MSPTPQVQALFDRALLAQRRRRAGALGPVTFLLDRVAEDMAERLSAVRRTFDVVVDLGTPTDAVRRILLAGGTIGRVIAAGCRAAHPARRRHDRPSHCGSPVCGAPGR